MLILFVGTGLAQTCDPWGVRLFFGQKYNKVPISDVLLRVVFNTDSNSCQKFQLTTKDQKVTCSMKTLQVNNANYKVSYVFQTTVHTCQIRSINFGNEKNLFSYEYTIASKTYTALIPPPNAEYPLKWLVIGDWGILTYGLSLYDNIFPCIDQQIKKRYAGILFMGDIAYDFETNNCQYYPQFLKAIQPYTSKFVWMSATGNHQSVLKRPISGYLYINSFILPENAANSNDFFSFSVGGTHFAVFNPVRQVYGQNPNDTPVRVKQLQDDYNKNGPYDWYIPFSHYPFYCSNSDINCYVGPRVLNFSRFFNSKNVKLYLSGHVHLYQRLFPIDQWGNVTSFKLRTLIDIDNNMSMQVFSQTTTPIYLIQGDAGHDKQGVTQYYPLLSYTSFSGVNTGYGILTFYNSTVLRYQRIKGRSADKKKTCYTEQGFYINRSGEGVQWWQIVLGVSLGLLLISIIIIISCALKKRPLISQTPDTDKQIVQQPISL